MRRPNINLFAALVVGVLALAPAARAEVRAQAHAPAAPENLLDDVDRIENLLADAKWDARRGTYVAPLGDGREADLTLDHRLQSEMLALLKTYRVPYGAVVALDPRDGRILAMAEHSQKEPSRGLAVRALYPAASVFKIVTGTALLEAGIEPDESVCYHGGKRRLEIGNLRDDPRRDRTCASLSTAMGKSLNVIFGKLALKNLSAASLRATAARFFFNQPLPVYPAPPSVDEALVSPARIPGDDDPLDFGRTAAGFGQVYLSPLHGALLAASVGNRGVAVEPHLVDYVRKAGVRASVPPPREQRVLSAETAAVLTGMMERTVSEGTARNAFRTRRGWVLKDVKVAGKTGSLSDHNPFKDYSWFVGFAPADEPRIAVAAVIVNGPKWTVKSPFIAREALRVFFENSNEGRKRASR